MLVPSLIEDCSLLQLASFRALAFLNKLDLVTIGTCRMHRQPVIQRL
jgi:hypothetical protein